MRRVLLIVGLISLPTMWASASPCVVENSSQFQYLIKNSREAAHCMLDVREKLPEYESYVQMASQAQVIEINKNMEIVLETPIELAGAQGMPLIIRVQPGSRVRMTGAGLSIAQAAGPVIVDGLELHNIDGPALEIHGDYATILRTRILHSGSKADAAVQIMGREARFENIEVVGSRAVGLFIGESFAEPARCGQAAFHFGKAAQLHQLTVRESTGDGVVSNARRVVLHDAEIVENSGAGLRVMTQSLEQRCASSDAAVNFGAYHGVEVARSIIHSNAGGAIIHEGYAPPRPVDLIMLSAVHADVLRIMGNVGRVVDRANPWATHPVDDQRMRVELYATSQMDQSNAEVYLATTDMVDAVNQQFHWNLPRDYLREQGIYDLAQWSFTAILTDTEYGHSSAFAEPLDAIARIDWDGDGVLNHDEDHNRDGLLGIDETDPRLADTDGDGLHDGEELLLLGRMHERIEAEHQPLVLRDLHALNPRNADSDGDCLPDGLEVGVKKSEVVAWTLSAESRLIRPRISLSPKCIQRLEERQLFTLNNVIPWDPSVEFAWDNIAALYDLDVTSMTDPTNADTDGDGLRDGVEDWNYDGQRNQDVHEASDAVAQLAHAQTAWRETDPTVADSDGDGIVDGDEFDAEGSHLHADSDDDGLSDAEERSTFGSSPQNCDTDADGLSDGVEAGRVHPFASQPECVGLQTAGTNFAHIAALDPTKADSDADGLLDGEEDMNFNGWLDHGESDPSVADTDLDGLNDYIETRLDFDGDGVTDILLSTLSNGAGCAPPTQLHDLDCDGLPNARDLDSDNDGCSDRDEGLDAGGDPTGLPAAFNAKVKLCGRNAGSSGGGASSSSAASANAAPAPEAPAGPDLSRSRFTKQHRGGGGCTLITVDSIGSDR